MRIDFLWTVGGPSVWDETTLATGLGGSETMTTLYARELARMGHQVTVWGRTLRTHTAEGVLWRNYTWWEADLCAGFVSHDADVVIAVRDPRPLGPSIAPVRAMLCNDRACDALPHAVESGACNLVITISEHQTLKYHSLYETIPAEMYLKSSAGVEWEAYEHPLVKVPGLCLYTSTPERGLEYLEAIWPRIYAQVPYARLVVSSGFELYGNSPENCWREPGNLYDRMAHLPGVTVSGMLPRAKLQELQRQAELLLYPSVYEEMCSIACLEAQAARCVIVTSPIGALSERVVDGVSGYLVDGQPGTPGYDDAFVESAAQALSNWYRWSSMADEGFQMAYEHRYAIQAAKWVECFDKRLHTLDTVRKV